MNRDQSNGSKKSKESSSRKLPIRLLFDAGLLIVALLVAFFPQWTAVVIQPGHLLEIRANGVFPEAPINGEYLVRPDGTIHLGPSYGSLLVAGRRPAQAEADLHQQLMQVLALPFMETFRVSGRGEPWKVDDELLAMETQARALRREFARLDWEKRDRDERRQAEEERLAEEAVRAAREAQATEDGENEAQVTTSLYPDLSVVLTGVSVVWPSPIMNPDKPEEPLKLPPVKLPDEP